MDDWTWQCVRGCRKGRVGAQAKAIKMAELYQLEQGSVCVSAKPVLPGPGQQHVPMLSKCLAHVPRVPNVSAVTHTLAVNPW